MSMITFYTQYKRPAKVYVERCGGELITEQAGYVPPKQQIEAMINAGERLGAYRKELYDFSDESTVDDTFSDPTRDVGFDLSDASRISKELNQKFKTSEMVKKGNESRNTAVPVEREVEKLDDEVTKKT